MRVEKVMIQSAISTEVTPMKTWAEWAARSDTGIPSGIGSGAVPFTGGAVPFGGTGASPGAGAALAMMKAVGRRC